MTEKKIGGYVFRQELSRARLANRVIRESLKRLVEEFPHQRAANLVAKAGTALAENMEALDEIEAILSRNRD
ncbi:hypothetical protein [Bellilinea caldifistulae]|uniref:Uncharacterized protein n=1 Tax=Bellilinea caldifistulae TaxID=360411 RepID=A0A0P6XGW6_9CHLR|nr:hypothetical protein [Bellilinea caldifistulae]KPL74566.1 hypothetical protein AC812_12280 [Bellilinea caldifistulae]